MSSGGGGLGEKFETLSPLEQWWRTACTPEAIEDIEVYYGIDLDWIRYHLSDDIKRTITQEDTFEIRSSSDGEMLIFNFKWIQNNKIVFSKDFEWISSSLRMKRLCSK